MAPYRLLLLIRRRVKVDGSLAPRLPTGFPILPSPVGRAPVNRLCCNSRCTRAPRFPSSAGMLPLKALLFKYNHFMPEALPSPVGMAPLNLLFAKSRCSRLVALPTPVMGPVNSSLPSSLRSVRVVIPNTAAGTLPDSPLRLRRSTVSLAPVRSEGMAPVSCL